MKVESEGDCWNWNNSIAVTSGGTSKAIELVYLTKKIRMTIGKITLVFVSEAMIFKNCMRFEFCTEFIGAL